MNQMSHLVFLSNISPLWAELLGLIPGVGIVENSPLRSQEVGEVSDFDISQVEADQEFVVEYHTSDPLVVGPTSHSWDGVDCTDVEEEENDSSSTSGQSFIVGRDLLGSNSFEEGPHVVQVTEDERILLGVVWVHVALFHVLHVSLIVSPSIFGFVDGFLSII